MPLVGGAQNAQDGVIPKFYMRPILNEKRTGEAGHPVYDDVEYVEVSVLGSNSSVGNGRVRDKHRAKWAKQYEAFKKGIEYIEEGYRLDEWSMVPRALCETFKGMGIHTVEQLAQLGDDKARYLDALALRNEAKKVLAGRDEKQEQLDELKEANKALLARLDALEAKPKPDPMAKARAAKKAKAEAAKKE